MDDQPVPLDLNAQDVSMDEALVVDGLREFEMPVDCRSLGANCRGFVARFFDKGRCVRLEFVFHYGPEVLAHRRGQSRVGSGEQT